MIGSDKSSPWSDSVETSGQDLGDIDKKGTGKQTPKGTNIQRKPRSTTPCDTRERSSSHRKRTLSEKRKTDCKFYSQAGFCASGVNCKFKHDYNQPMSSYKMRCMMDGIMGGIKKIRGNQEVLGDKIEELNEKIESNQMYLISELKKLSLTPRDAVQKNPHTMKKDDNLKSRALQYTQRSHKW